ncbi:HTH-type transcriptional regulator MetR [Plesiomonas sp.]|uniref:HTH-type transcriptional regulator MetR n=1 Tax=Plesiomonas sp. TaxID=2486279 RepID=UPI003F2A64C9
MIELRHLTTLSVLHEQGSLTRAAIVLHQTQSALSHQIADLEQRLGYPLFIRKSQPIKFTPQGTLLLELAKEILPKIQHVENQITANDPQIRANLNLAIECHSCIQWLTPALTQFKESWPHTDLNFTAATTFDPQPLLAQGELDLVITSDIQPRTDLFFAPLFDFEMRWIISPQHRLAEKYSLAAADFEIETLLVYPVQKQRLDAWRRFLQPANIQPKLKTVDSTLLQIQMVAAGMGVAALPHWAVFDVEQQGLLCTKSIGEKGLWRRLYAGVRCNEQHDQAIQHFLRCTRAQMGHLPGIKFINT